MKSRELIQLGIPRGESMHAAQQAIRDAADTGMNKSAIRNALESVVAEPGNYHQDTMFGALARSLFGRPEAPPTVRPDGPAPWKQWGKDLDRESIDQMKNACALPVSVRGALMPDAHVGYGLPIGGVLATKDAVIPYAVGVDIACRMKMTVLDLPLKTLDADQDRLKKAIQEETRFGIGAKFENRRHHEVLDENWNVSPITRHNKDKAWSQLGTSGSGNHFVEFGELEIVEPGLPLEPGRYLALLSHSGSRGTGASVCDHYSKLAMGRHKELPRPMQHLGWLDLDTHEGQEYWAAMELMGKYAAANHACIHREIAKHLGVKALLDIENHHNFAWKEEHDGEEVIVHRKGATPAGEGVIGIIPGSMATPGFVVRGRGNEDSLNSAAHGAGRVMSRKQAKKTLSWEEANALLKKSRVTLISAGIDEVPMVYKNINEVMSAQSDLVDILARFHPRLVKMAPAGERAED
jgi:tRNA-splicing ligase RtcB